MLPEKRLCAYPGDQIRKAADRDIDLPRFQLRHKPGAPQRNRRKAHMRGGLLGPVLEPREGDRKSVVSGKSVSVRVDLGGRRIIKKKKRRLIYIKTEEK